MLSSIRINLRDTVVCLSFAIVIYSVHLLNIYKIWGPNENAVLALLSGFVFLITSINNGNTCATDQFKKSSTAYERLSVVLLGSIISIMLLQGIITPFPMDKTNSDVIPQINVLVNRLLNGDYPYTSIDFKTYTLFPTYLPLQWLPFTLAELLGIDYRIFALFILLIPVAFMLFKVKNRFQFYLSALLVFSMIILGIEYNKDDYFNCVENIIAAYYLTFALSLLYTKNIWIQVIFLSVCLFSRYSIILWTPLFFIYIFINHGFTKFIISLGLLFFIFLAVYGLPFLTTDPLIFFKAYEYHTSAAIGEWKLSSDCNHCSPFHLSRGLGMAIFFYDNQTNIAYRLAILQKVHLILSLLSVAATSVYVIIGKYLYGRNVGKHFIIWSFALYLTIFYHFIQIPYHYLFSVPVVIYLVLFVSYFKYDKT